MKISALIATLALSPVFLHAQAAAPAQELQARLNGAQPLTSAAADRTSATTAPLRVSTGVVPARLIHSVDVASTLNAEWRLAGDMRSAQVALTVDTTGKPTNLRILKSAGADLDQNVLDAVSQYRFSPATISNQAAPMNVELTVNILKPTNW